MELSQEGAVTASVAAMLAIGLWGVFVSVKSADSGPEWAEHALKRSAPMFIVVALAGLVVMVLVSPAWLGFVVMYLGGVGAWLSRMFSRRIGVLLELGGDSERSRASRDEAARKAGQGLMGMGALLLLFGSVNLGQPMGWLLVVGAIICAAGGWRLFASSRPQ